MPGSILFLLLIVLQLADATCTELFYHVIGEGNPLMQYMIETTGFTGLYVVKGAVILIVLVIAYIAQMHRRYVPPVKFALTVGVVIEAVVVGAWVVRYLLYLLHA